VIALLPIYGAFALLSIALLSMVLHSYLLRSYLLHSNLLHSYLWYLWCTYHRCSYRRNLRAPYCTYLLRLTRVRLYELSTLLAMP